MKNEVIKTNGCGPSSNKFIAWLVPDLCFGPCCKSHDVDYSIGGSEKERMEAEVRFLDCMVDSTEIYPWYSKWVLLFLAHVYSFCTKKWGRAMAWNKKRKADKLYVIE